ncbi:3-isopropylmalate dehydratase large subunit [Leptospira sp. 96542]|nr:3-isopropylmalate dehydratase large subunit [Leptospira sp. 96542]
MKTLFDKLWSAHEILKLETGESVLFVDRHLLHEVTSAQAFEGLRHRRLKPKFPNLTLGVIDHNVSTKDRKNDHAAGPVSFKQMKQMEINCSEFGISLLGKNHKNQGIVHVISPELGFTIPGGLIVCGDSHTSTHGAFGALAFGIGTSEVEHVLTTQTLVQKKPKSMLVRFIGELPKFCTAKDLALGLIESISTSGGAGYVIEYQGEVIQNLSMEERMTLCNLTVEAGARAGLIKPDQKTKEYLKNKQYSPKGDLWEKATEYWDSLYSDHGVHFDKVIEFKLNTLAPKITWGTNPSQAISINEPIPNPEQILGEDNTTYLKALEYMDLKPGMKMTDVTIDNVFIGSCTNGRLSDLEEAASQIKGQKVHRDVTAIVVPGSMEVKRLAESKGIDTIFKDAGFEWREPGCSMCLAMNDDVLGEYKRSASTSNRNFEGRQGKLSRTHLVSPAMAALAAIHGRFVDMREV